MAIDMTQEKKNKELIIAYYNAISGIREKELLCRRFTDDQSVIDYVTLLDRAFPGYELFVDELIAEGNRVVVRARIVGEHKRPVRGIAPADQKIDLPFAIGYEIGNSKILGFWLFADQILSLDQLGISIRRWDNLRV